VWSLDGVLLNRSAFRDGRPGDIGTEIVDDLEGLTAAIAI
jgi:hypothetical protein